MVLSRGFENFPISYILENKGQALATSIVSVHEDTTLAKTLDILSQENILAVPIFEPANDYSAKRFTGIVSVHDILSFAVFQQIFDSSIVKNDNDALQSLNRFKKDAFLNIPIKKVLTSRPEEPIPAVLSSEDSIESLIKIFSEGHHRALVVTTTVILANIPAESSLAIISQLDLVKYLYDTQLGNTKVPSEFVERIFTLPLEFANTEKRVIAISDFQPTLAGFNVMHLNGVHSLPVIDKEDHVVGTLSAKDLRGLTFENIDRLMEPVSVFVKVASKSKQSIDLADRKIRVEDAIALMLKDRIHHVWVVDKQVVTGVFTPTDLCKLFLTK